MFRHTHANSTWWTTKEYMAFSFAMNSLTTQMFCSQPPGYSTDRYHQEVIPKSWTQIPPGSPCISDFSQTCTERCQYPSLLINSEAKPRRKQQGLSSVYKKTNKKTLLPCRRVAFKRHFCATSVTRCRAGDHRGGRVHPCDRDTSQVQRGRADAVPRANDVVQAR